MQARICLRLAARGDLKKLDERLLFDLLLDIPLLDTVDLFGSFISVRRKEICSFRFSLNFSVDVSPMLEECLNPQEKRS